MFVCCEWCVLSGRGLCDGLITRPEESYRLWRVVCVISKTSWMRRPYPALGCSAIWKKNEVLWLNSHVVFLSPTKQILGTNLQLVSTTSFHAFTGHYSRTILPFISKQQQPQRVSINIYILIRFSWKCK
jgi:hypothetical protein